MIQQTMLGGQYAVRHVKDAEGADMVTLSFLDPHGAGQWVIPLSPEAAAELAADLTGKPSIAIAPASALPKVRG